MTEEQFNQKTSPLNVIKKEVIRRLIEENKNAFDVDNVTKYECPINLKKYVYVLKTPYQEKTER